MKFSIRYSVLAAFGLVFFLASMALAADPPKPLEGDRCSVCGMFVYKYQSWIATVVFNDGTHAFFDGPKDMFRYMNAVEKFNPGMSAVDVAQVYVTDYYTTKVVKADEVFFILGSDVMGPMGEEFVVVSNEEDARSFMKDHGGDTMLRFDQVTPADIPD